MFNILLDELPTEYMGYKINSDFRVGIQISQAQNDNTLTDTERLLLCIDLLFGQDDSDDIPDYQVACDGIKWFLTDWYRDNLVKNEDKDDVIVSDYDVDQWRIYSAFLTQYGINLNTCEMHYWVFMGLLTTLQDCSYTRVIDIRSRKIPSKLSYNERQEWIKAKQKYTLMTEEEELTKADMQEIKDDFLQQLYNGEAQARRKKEFSKEEIDRLLKQERGVLQDG